MKAKTKFLLIKWITALFVIPLYLFTIGSIYVLLKVDVMWEGMFVNGIKSFAQWITLIIFRLLIYIPIPLMIGIFKFDNRYNYSSRVIVWYNWMFFLYLIAYALYQFFAIDLLAKITIFNTLSVAIMLLGYIFTLIKRKPISFDNTGNILKK